MDTQHTNFTQQLLSKVRNTRREFLKRFAITTGVVVGGRLVSPQVAKATQASLNHYPTPQYVPDGYQLVAQNTDRIDGFNGGSSELAYWYMNLKHSLGGVNPLSIYVSPQPQKATLATTENRRWMPVVISMTSGEIFNGKYYDGMWVYDQEAVAKDEVKLVWNTQNAHSLVWDYQGMTIGIRGARQVNVGFEELIRIAASMT